MAAVRAQVEQWRRERVRRGPMPEELWAEVVLLARTHGCFRVARGVGVDYGALKQRVGTSGAMAPTDGESISVGGFVELPSVEAAVPGALHVTAVELVGMDGSRVVVRLAAEQRVDVPGLLAALWGRRA